MKIFKYELSLRDLSARSARGEVEVTRGARLLTVQVQRDVLYAWFLFDETEHGKEWFKLRIVGTGPSENLTGWDYFCTVQQLQYVWHVFVEAEKKVREVYCATDMQKDEVVKSLRRIAQLVERGDL